MEAIRNAVRALLVLGILGMTPGVANAATWSIQPTYSPVNHQGGLAGVSCSASDACTAVGDYLNSEYQQTPAAERWDGMHWRTEAIPAAVANAAPVPQGVSCAALDWCMTVGYNNPTGSAGSATPFAESWNGSTWTVESVPLPEAAFSGALTSVSCRSQTMCEAVGFDNDGPIAEGWDGSSWSLQTIPVSAVVPVNQLVGVSCSADNACAAVGWGATSTSQEPVAGLWNGSTWTFATPPMPPGAGNGHLLGVSCVAASSCSAVGSSWPANGSDDSARALAERWDGTSWSLQSAAEPSGITRYSRLASVSCTADNACSAVGSWWGAKGGMPLTEKWDGVDWSLTSAPRPRRTGKTQLTSTSCTAVGDCLAVGATIGDLSQESISLAEHYDGTRWALEGIPTPPQQSSTMGSGISCTTTSACTFVGSYDNKSGLPLAERWDGLTWAQQTTVNPNPWSALTAVAFRAISCPTASWCMAVGSTSEFWNGTKWHPVSPGALTFDLSAVSCTDSHMCVASNGTSTAWRWDGTAWAQQPVSTSSAAIQAVSCTAGDACTAVGWSGSSQSPTPLVERWGGSSWVAQSVIVPSNAVKMRFNGVSCSSASKCTAVGDYWSSAGWEYLVAEHWNGVRWSLQPISQSPSATSLYSLNGVSCPTTTSCTAIGSIDGTTNLTTTLLAESWDGTSWTQEAIPPPDNPATDSNFSLQSVSCAAPNQCQAIGTYRDSFGVNRLFLETLS